MDSRPAPHRCNESASILSARDIAADFLKLATTRTRKRECLDATCVPGPDLSKLIESR